jgi:hypothetical protein
MPLARLLCIRISVYMCRISIALAAGEVLSAESTMQLCWRSSRHYSLGERLNLQGVDKRKKHFYAAVREVFAIDAHFKLLDLCEMVVGYMYERPDGFRPIDRCASCHRTYFDEKTTSSGRISPCFSMQDGLIMYKMPF